MAIGKDNNDVIILVEDYDVTQGNRLFYQRVDRKAPNGFSIQVICNSLLGTLDGEVQIKASNIEEEDKFINYPGGGTMTKVLNTTMFNYGFDDETLNYKYIGLAFDKKHLTGGTMTVILKIN